ncbi:hypothetical protein Tco_0752750 [Tanacetum coccineum]|uniref:Uncharacterized protein n=1 Tax=Tanacetum coccineum TaxID=301880 RepID=A0ABQ4Z7R6_9ASTR
MQGTKPICSRQGKVVVQDIQEDTMQLIKEEPFQETSERKWLSVGRMALAREMSKANATSRFILLQGQDSQCKPRRMEQFGMKEHRCFFSAGDQVPNEFDDDVDDFNEKVKRSTEASGSKPRSNYKKNRTLPAKKEKKKREVEDA